MAPFRTGKMTGEIDKTSFKSGGNGLGEMCTHPLKISTSVVLTSK